MKKQIMYVPLSNMIGFKPAVARVRAANSPDGPDPTITTEGAGFSESSICPCVLAFAVTELDSKKSLKKRKRRKRSEELGKNKCK